MRIWDYDLNYSMLSREIKFSQFNGDQGGRMYQVREGYFRVVREILDRLW